MIKLLKAVCKTWQNKNEEKESIRLRNAQWAIAHKIDKQNKKQFLLVEIVPFVMHENEPPISRVLH